MDARTGCSSQDRGGVMAVREAICRNCATDFEFAARGGVARPLCQHCESTYKWCSSCGYALVHQAFNTAPRNRDGLEAKCKHCKAAGLRDRRARGYRSDPRSLRASKLKSRYGLSLGQWDEMVIAHGGRCAICDKPSPDIHVDHCHRTGAIRGLLCPPCNKGLGHFKDDVDRIMSAVAYLLTDSEG